jgi:hypothetical protein
MQEIQFYDPVLGEQYKNIMHDIEKMFQGKQDRTELPGETGQSNSLEEY